MTETNKKLTHIAGTFLIQAEGAFLNGGGLAKGEYGNTTTPKTFVDFKDKVPYVSSQAWKRWLRNTFQEENPSLPHAKLKQIGISAKGTTNKIGTEMDPVKFPEDDIFGYMRAQEGQGKVVEEDEGGSGIETEVEAKEDKKKKKEKTKSVMRPAPFAASILTSLRKSGWQGLDKAYVHLQEGTPQPYNTEFYNTQLQGIFGLSYSRLGVFRNEGDRVELDEKYVEKYIKDGTIKVVKETSAGKWYELKNNLRKNRATAILKSLAVMRGGAKQAQFATDIAPKTIVFAGLSCGNLIFNDLFEDSKEGPILKLKTLEEVITDYKDRIATKVFIGIRDGYLSKNSEQEVKSWQGKKIENIEVTVTSPVDAISQMVENLP
ncbi:MAG: DevR family CRISPR-associated autoregulator [Nitrospirae bacterium]|nr:DevR family CRISPR-associated autoregulator [Nitrospirota bacterium]